MSTYAINKAVNGIEITFESKPAESVRDLMKANGFRWHKVKKIWYAKNTADRLQIAQDITSGNAAPAPAPAAIDMSDWGGEYGPGYMGGSCWKGSKSAHCMSTAELNKAIRADLKAHGISGVTLRKEHYSSILATITATAADLTPEGLEDMSEWGIQVNQYAVEKYADKFAPAFLAKVKAVNECINSYRYDDSNAMVDYFNSNFYYSLKVVTR